MSFATFEDTKSSAYTSAARASSAAGMGEAPRHGGGALRYAGLRVAGRFDNGSWYLIQAQGRFVGFVVLQPRGVDLGDRPGGPDRGQRRGVALGG
jgi:hypothetical protein